VRSIHLVVGAWFFGAFLVTGFLMSVHVPPLPDSDASLRLLYRSRHVYLMFAACTNVLLGLYLREHEGPARPIQRAGSVLLILSPVVGLVGFARDPLLGTLEAAVFGRYAVFALFGGTGLHLLAEMVARRPSRR
jgi:hypothetical protein